MVVMIVVAGVTRIVACHPHQEYHNAFDTFVLSSCLSGQSFMRKVLSIK
jgi:hypothetical protein